MSPHDVAELVSALVSIDSVNPALVPGGAGEEAVGTHWMDDALIQAAAIVVFGPGGEGAHSVDEWVDLASVDACAEGLVAAAHEFCT